MYEGIVEVNGKRFQIEIEWSGKRGTYNQWWRTWAAEIVDGKVKEGKPLCGCIEVGYQVKYPLETMEQVINALTKNRMIEA